MMKKIASLCMMLTLMASAYAQDGGFQFGFHISPTISFLGNNADRNAIEPDGSSFAFKIGADGEYFFRENYAIKSGIAISFNQGGKLKFNNLPVGGAVLFADSQPNEFVTPENNVVRLKYQYLEIPFGLKMRSNQFGFMRYFAEIPIITFGFNVGARADVEGGNEYRISDDTNIMQMSWGLGGGAEYAVSESVSIVGGIYYQDGFINTYNAKTGLDFIDETKTKSRMIEIRLGVLF